MVPGGCAVWEVWNLRFEFFVKLLLVFLLHRQGDGGLVEACVDDTGLAGLTQGRAREEVPEEGRHGG